MRSSDSSSGRSTRSTQSTLSSIDGDSLRENGKAAARTGSAERRPKPSSSNSRSSLRRRASGSGSGSPGSGAGTFLARFISSFRGQPSTSSSSTNSLRRPTLPRSVSTPLVSSFDDSRNTRAYQPGQASLGEPVFSSSFLAERLRPSFIRRATTGTPSPPSSPPVTGESSGLSSPDSLHDREENPMESVTPQAFAPGRIGGPDLNALMTKRGSVTSQRTVLPGSTSSPLASPLGRVRPIGVSALQESEHPPRLEQPLVLIATLLPPALLLLSFLGPAHLFSPPLILPSLDSVASPWDRSSEKDRHVAPDAASIASSHASSSYSLPKLQSSQSIPPGFSHELHAPSTLSIPAVSAAAVWRLFRGLEWVTEAGSQSEEIREDVDSPFDFPAVLQGVTDALAAHAASRGVELVVGQAGAGSAPSPIATPSVPEGQEQPTAPPRLQRDTESRELLVRGDERAWSVVLIWILQSIVGSAESGSTIEVHFVATVASPPPPQPADMRGSHDTILPTRQSIEEWWTVSLEVLHTYASDTGSDSPSPLFPSPIFTSSFAQSLFSFTNLNIDTGPSDVSSRSWVIEALLPAARPILPTTEDPSILLERQRAILDGPGHEPSMQELRTFAENGLKGTKVLLHAGEQSTFAKQLTTHLADWGMDVAHVPLDRDDDSASTSGTSQNESAWNKGRRETFGRFDSGFGGSADSASPEPSNSPLKGPYDYPSPSSSSAGGEAPSSVIIVDDDIVTLRRLLYTLRSNPVTSPPTLMGKRPQLASRRTRSSPHVRQLHQLPPMGSGWVIIHFASLSHYKAIKEIVQDALANCRSPSLPDVLVIPKPAGPRRIITALWTALKRPAVDPSLAPIATSPTSPGVQYWTPRLSPALANQQDFDSAAAEALAARTDSSPSSAPKVRTPPLHFTGVSAATHPPSPLGKISDEQVSYFSCVAENMDGTTPSEGMVIQSPDGRPAIFFQPQQTRPRTSLNRKDTAGSRPMEREEDVAADGLATPPSRGHVTAPHEIGLGGRRSTHNSPTVGPSSEQHPLAPPDTPALTLDSFIAKSRGQSEESSPELTTSPTEAQSPLAGSRSSSSASLTQRPIPRPHVNTSPRPPITSYSSRLINSPPTPVRVESPSPGGHANPGGLRREASTLTSASPPPHSRRSSLAGGGHGGRRKHRKSTLPPTVPPINVLIVEDNPINQAILSMFMKKKGIKYAVAKDGEEAVQKWKAGSFHLVLMDIQLPVKDGIEATRDIREMERADNVGTFITTPTSDSTSPMASQATSPTSPPLSMPVIIVALTASSLQVDRVTALAAGCNDFLTKPVSLPWLQQKLLEWGSMAYLSGFSQASSASDSAELAQSRPAFSAGLNAKAKADAISAHLHIDPRPHSRSSSPGRRPITPSPPSLTVTNPTPVLTPGPAVSVPIEKVATINEEGIPNLSAVDSRLEDLKAQGRRPGPSPLSPADATLESVFAEGERILAVSRSRGNSVTSDSFSRVSKTHQSPSMISGSLSASRR
ncbi:osomolarity two-component system, response regulator SSK1, partial [Phenoliferia sp. Uapishka_3]